MLSRSRFLKGAAWAALFFLCFPALATAQELRPVATNDTFLGKQWSLDAISARDGWNATTGSRDVIVAVVDGGMDITHEDLKGNVWTNPGEIPGNGKDDDGNGYIDDVHGWNFDANSPNVQPGVSAKGPEEAWIHATAVASIIAASGNNDVGIAGVAWRARIMPLVVLDANGFGGDDSLVRAIRYAVAQGADIINLSLFGAEYDATLDRAVREATSQGVLVVSAAGNGDSLGGDNLNLLPGYPACDSGSGGKLTVTGLDRNLKKSSRANYGSCVDVAAPGEDIFAARPPRDSRGRAIPVAGYVGDLTGTSIAAPFVSGLAALLKAEHPSWRGPELARRILDTADSVDDANPQYRGALGRGIINVSRALAIDPKSRKEGPLSLEGSEPGKPPEVRVLAEDGTELRRFAVGDSGDRRGVRATFLRMSGQFEPDIAVSTVGDRGGNWRIYRSDGLLVAAGSVATNVNGGLTLAAQDLDSSGTDTLFLGEADGRRAWLLLPLTLKTTEVDPFTTTTARGIAALTMTRPIPAFLAMTTKGDAMIAAIGRNGERLDIGSTIKNTSTNGWIPRRADRAGLPSVFQAAGTKKNITYIGDATGVHEAKTPPAVARWAQTPLGEARHAGWRSYDLWPR